MKSQHILMFVLIAFGAITGSTLATIDYLNYRQSVPNLPNSSNSSPQSQDYSFPNSLNLDKRQTASNHKISLPQKTITQLSQTDFSEFRLSFLNAVKRRDAIYINALVTPETQASSDDTIYLEDYNIDDPESPFWQKIEKAVSAGCTVQKSENDVWVCPETFGKPIYSSGWREQVAILGERVNVRAKPESGSRIVGVLSKELVKFDFPTFNNLLKDERELVNAIDGWTPVILKNGKKGWVQNQFVFYEARDYRVSFVRTNGQWRLRYLFPGEGN